jgi:SAM-dependent methyltransferase
MQRPESIARRIRHLLDPRSRWGSEPADEGTHFGGFDDLLVLSEAKALLAVRPWARVLEIGPGSGSFYDALFSTAERYEGVELSVELVRRFQAGHPTVPIRQGDLRTISDVTGFDLVFSHQVVQYVTTADLDRHLATVRRTAPEATVAHLGLPWAGRRVAYATEATRVDLHPKWTRLPLTPLRARSLGTWFDPTDLATLAAKHGFVAHFAASATFTYRFHCVFTPAGSTG